jgi:hypothetical protein
LTGKGKKGTVKEKKRKKCLLISVLRYEKERPLKAPEKPAGAIGKA